MSKNISAMKTVTPQPSVEDLMALGYSNGQIFDMAADWSRNHGGNIPPPFIPAAAVNMPPVQTSAPVTTTRPTVSRVAPPPPAPPVMEYWRTPMAVAPTTVNDNVNLISMATHGGMSSMDVKEIQATLNRLGVRDMNGNKLAVDGYFGPLTDSSVRNFQTQNGLMVDGIVGPQTRGAFSAQEPDFVGAGEVYKPGRRVQSSVSPERQAYADAVMAQRAARQKAQAVADEKATSDMHLQNLTRGGKAVIDEMLKHGWFDLNEALLAADILENHIIRRTPHEVVDKELEALVRLSSYDRFVPLEGYAQFLRMIFRLGGYGLDLAAAQTIHDQQFIDEQQRGLEILGDEMMPKPQLLPGFDFFAGYSKEIFDAIKPYLK